MRQKPLHRDFPADIPRKRRKALPGDEGLWYFIAADLTLFALLFGSFSYQRSLDIDAFEASRLQLLPIFAALNTLLLLTSSYFMVLAVRARLVGDRARAAGLTVAAAALGIAFVLFKVIEYVREIKAGHVPTSSGLFTYYFVITGIHLLHVIGATTLLIIISLKLHAKKKSDREMTLLESGASFWHMVDMLWLIIFPLLYLLR